MGAQKEKEGDAMYLYATRKALETLLREVGEYVA